MTITVGWVGLSILAALFFKWIVDFGKALKSIEYLPGARTLLPASGLWGVLFQKPIPLIIRGTAHSWLRGHRDFEEHAVDIISMISFFPTVSVILSLADASAIKEVTMHRTRFPKPVAQYGPLNVFGPNIVASEGDEWKRYRKISSPAFSESNNRLVWNVTMKIMLDLFDNVWTSQQEIVVQHAADITLPIALFVIGAAGFGMEVGWDDRIPLSSNHKMSFKEALHHATSGLFIKAIAPNWLLDLGPTTRWRQVKLAYDELEIYMLDMIASRKSNGEREDSHRFDLFSNLLAANEDDFDGQTRLSDRELMGNVFTFLLAGHETTAQTLCFAFGLLALHQDFQERLYQHIQSIIPSGRTPAYEDMKQLTLSLATLYETLRLCPTVPGIPKISAQDTTLVTTSASGERIVVPVAQGTKITLNVAALHYNPRYWDDPHAFKPERFLGDWPRDAFLGFSGGARSCLGRRFFETEAVAILTMFVPRYRFDILEEPVFAGESFEQRKTRILEAHRGVTMAPIKMPLIFKRRCENVI